jgi:uncharacterized membrane protein
MRANAYNGSFMDTQRVIQYAQAWSRRTGEIVCVCRGQRGAIFAKLANEVPPSANIIMSLRRGELI